MIDAALRSPSMIVHRFLARFCPPKANKWDGWNLLSQSSKIRIVSLWVKAIKCWSWLMRWFESLIKSLIEPNTPTLLHPMCFLLIFNQLLDQQNITVNLLNLCPFPEPNSRVLELYTHSFSSPFIQTVESSQDKTFLSHPIRMHRPPCPDVS